jgi:hypothetical protein
LLRTTVIRLQQCQGRQRRQQRLSKPIVLHLFVAPDGHPSLHRPIARARRLIKDAKHGTPFVRAHSKDRRRPAPCATPIPGVSSSVRQSWSDVCVPSRAIACGRLSAWGCCAMTLARGAASAVPTSRAIKGPPSMTTVAHPKSSELFTKFSRHSNAPLHTLPADSREIAAMEGCAWRRPVVAVGRGRTQALEAALGEGWLMCGSRHALVTRPSLPGLC